MQKPSNNLSGGFCIVAALAILLLPLSWLLSFAAAVLFHEFCHLLTLRLLSGKWMPLSLFASGARIPIPSLSRGRELLCALAGPAGSLLLVLLHPAFPLLAFFGLAQGLYNLLPIYPLDGGRVLRCAADMLLSPNYALWLQEFLSSGCIGAILAAAFYKTLFGGWGILPMLAALTVFYTGFAGNCPCKRGRLALQ